MPFLSGKPSPLERIGNRDQYFEDVLSISQKQDFRHSNGSSLSLDSIKTAERLLDKLELSAGDELLLQKALQEEDKVRLENTKKGPVVCLPANAFPSLRTSKVHQRQNSNGSWRENNVGNLMSSETVPIEVVGSAQIVRGGALATSVERHIPEHYRYSYIVEEDTDLESLLSTSTQKDENPNVSSLQDPPKQHNFNKFTGLTSDRRYHYYRNHEPNGRKPVNSSMRNERIRAEEKDLTDFEKYRIENSTLIREFPHLMNNQQQRKLHYYHELVKNPGKKNEPSTLAKEIIETGSKTWNNDPTSLYKPKTTSSGESSIVDKRDKFNTPTPKKSSSNTTLDKSFESELSQPPTPSFSDHKKKSSLSSFKSFFKSPKNYKNKNRSDDKLENLESPKTTVQKNTPKKNSTSSENLSKNIKKYMFPNKNNNDPIKFSQIDNSHIPKARPVVRKPSHIRSHSDFGTIHLAQERLKKIERTPLYSSNLNVPNAPIRNASHRRTKSAELLTGERSDSTSSIDKMDSSVNIHDNIPLTTVYSVTHTGNKSAISLLITESLTLKNEGKLNDSSKKLHEACIKGSKTACLLYGIALRKGEGVEKDYRESLRYLHRATGIANCDEFVTRSKIDPTILEIRKDEIPDIPPQPLAPAFYECGVSYLKGYGIPSPNSTLGLKYLEYAASLGHVDAMCLSGILLSKNQYRSEEDVFRAASWFRIAEKRGANLIGSNWIHKKQYKKNIIL
ncbi:Protein DSF2 [Nakaseomyces bracarensis]|uniref:Protein DSF2 n=1 Tax=Nakaseomyces bracarensis TaxID=273131 RepID=A0ABR4NQU4_9SACH